MTNAYFFVFSLGLCKVRSNNYPGIVSLLIFHIVSLTGLKIEVVQGLVQYSHMVAQYLTSGHHWSLSYNRILDWETLGALVTIVNTQCLQRNERNLQGSLLIYSDSEK